MTRRQKTVLGVDVCMAFMQILIDRGIDLPNVKNLASLLNNAAMLIAEPLKGNQVEYLHKIITRDYPTNKELRDLTGYQYFSLTFNVLVHTMLEFEPVRKTDKQAVRNINLARGKLLSMLEDVSDEDLEIGAEEADLFIKKLKL